MGVKTLWDILESCKKIHPLHHLQNKRVCVDLSCWTVQLQNVNKSHCPMNSKLYLRSLFHRLRALIALNCTIIFVSDGSIPAIKVSTYRRRLNSGCEVTQEESKSYKGPSLKRNMGSEFSCMIKEAKALGMALGIPCLDGIEEAEAQCAMLNSEMFCDGCFTSDSDAFLFGARTVYRDICLGEGGYVTCYEMADVESNLGFGRNSLITLALLLGSDYSQGVHGIGQDSACQIVKAIGEAAVLQRVASEGLSFAKKSKGSKKGGKIPKGHYKENEHELCINGSERNTQILQVIDAYLKPKCHTPDSDAVRRALSVYPFQRCKLQMICDQFFDWPPEKTDEYILPKIAERDLRRFANLRKVSSNVGLQLPLNEMPVKCPISKILKSRKVEGRNCFEVSWEDINGLESSIVPADLVECACSEKILEFEENKLQGKKQKLRKPRQEKNENKTTAELDKRLQDLLLDIELGSNSTHRASSPLRSSKSDSRNSHTEIDVADQCSAQNEVVDLFSPSPIRYISKCQDAIGTLSDSFSFKSSKSDHRISDTEIDLVKENPFFDKISEMGVIDLLSPSPAIHTVRHMSRCQEASGRHDVIDLSESENDMSPEHTKKARELRLFITSIREEENS